MSASSPTEPARSRDEPAGPEQSEDVGTSGDRQRGSWAAPGASGLAGPAAPEQDDDTPEDPLRHRLLTRIPGLSRLAEQSGWMGGSSDDAATQDDGWVYHEGDGDSFQGWLYHYADGTMVDPDGVEYAFPDTSAGDQPASEPVKVEPEAVAEATAEPDAEPDEAPAPGAEVDAAPSAEAEAEPEPEPAADVEPEAEAETEVPPEAPSEAEPEPRPDLILVAPPPADADATADADAAIETESEDETEPDAAEPDAAEPVAAESAAPEPKPAEPEPQHAAELPAGVPRFVEYTPTHVRGYLLGGVFVLASVAAVLTLFVAVSESSVAALVIAGGCVVLAVVAWWALLGWRPTVVTITEGVIDVTRGGHTERFEVAEPSTSVEFSGRPGSPTWTAALRTRNGPRTILRSSHVKPRQFERIVRHYRATAPDEDVPA